MGTGSDLMSSGGLYLSGPERRGDGVEPQGEGKREAKRKWGEGGRRQGLAPC